ncbi:MAG: hypothetical protein FVQ79_07325 [Planctomycetes bacterium]|nr:hypothetical protein [Planctomycetota bacterium]
MEFSLNAEEILAIVEEIKLNGVAFYKHLARYGPKGEVRKMLVKLVEMEERHAMCFAEMRSHLSEHDKESTVFHRGSDEWMYLREMAGHHVFEVESDPCELLDGDITADSVVRLAIDKEKDLMIFILELKRVVLSRDRNGQIEAIISEEMKHIAELGRFAALQDAVMSRV